MTKHKTYVIIQSENNKGHKSQKKESQKGKDHDEQRFCIRIIISV